MEILQFWCFAFLLHRTVCNREITSADHPRESRLSYYDLQVSALSSTPMQYLKVYLSHSVKMAIF